MEAAGRNLDQLAEQIEGMSKSGVAHFAAMDQSLGGVAAATLMSAAAMTPYGRALTAAAILLGLPDHAERFADIGRRRRSAMARFEAASTALTQALRSPHQ